MNISNPLFTKGNPLPCELIIETDNGLTLFEQEAKKRLNPSIYKHGCKFGDAHIKLGSKIHLKDFYYAEKLFRNSYYAIRFAYLIYQYISQKLGDETNGKITILGYGLYSELLVSNVARFLNKAEKNNSRKRQFNHSIIEDVEDLKLLIPVEKQVILVIPIGTTLTTQLKIYRKLQREKKSERKCDFVLNPICVLVIGHGEIRNIADLEGEIRDKRVKKFWEKINLKEKEIYLAGLSGKEDEKIGKTRYFIYLPSEWQLPHLCKYCWEEGGEEIKTPFDTDKVSITPQIIFGTPKAKKEAEELPTVKIIFSNSNGKSDNAVISPEMLKYGHFKRGTNHYLFYIDTIEFFNRNKEAIEKWLWKLKENLQKKHPGLLKESCMLVAPTHETNVDFINLVNEQLFNDAANVEYFDPFTEHTQNPQYLLQNLFSKESKNLPYIFFIDDVLCTGKTLNRIQEYLKISGITADLAGCLVMINRLPGEIDQHHKKKNIHSFANLEAPVADTKEKCYLCKEEGRYKKVLENTVVDALRKKIRSKLNKKLEVKDASKESSKDNDDGSVKSQKTFSPLTGEGLGEGELEGKFNDDSKKIRHLRKLELTHELYHKLSEMKKLDVEKLIAKMSGNHRETKTILVKTLSQAPFIYYEKIKKGIYPYLLKELKATLGKVGTEIEYIQYALILVKRLAYLGCPQMLTSGFLEKIKVVRDNRKLHKKWPELKEEIAKIRKKAEIRKKNEQYHLFEPTSEPTTDDIIREKIDKFCQYHNFNKPSWEHLRNKGEKPEDSMGKFMENTVQFTLAYGLAVKEIITNDQPKAFRFEWELDKLLKNNTENNNPTIDESNNKDNEKFAAFLKFLSLENNIIVRNARNALKEILAEQTPPCDDSVTNAIKTDYRFSYLRYLINYNKFLEKNAGEIPTEKEFQQISDKLDDQFVKTEFYRNTFAPLLKLSSLIKTSSEAEKSSIYQNDQVSERITPILEELIKIAHIDKQSGGAFLAIKKGYSLFSQVSDLYIVGKIGKNSDGFNKYLKDEHSWTIKMFNGVKTSPEGEKWTNVERYKGDDDSKYNPEISFDDLYEYKKLEASHFLFLKIAELQKKNNEEVSDTKGVLVLYKNKPFSPKEQRYLLLLRKELCDFLEKHYENYSFEEWITEYNRSEMRRKIAHDLKTPLTRLRENIADCPEDPKKREETRAIINSSIKNIDDTLALIQLETVQMKKEKCWLHSFFKKLEEANDFIKFSIDIPDNVYIMADIQNIKRVFNNLFQNAIDNNATKIMIRLHEAQLLIENTGKEIPPETEKKIFDKEFSTKPYGSGLGLHIVREILLHHNARIELISANPVIFSISFKEVEYEIN